MEVESVFVLTTAWLTEKVDHTFRELKKVARAIAELPGNPDAI